jgi:hypothetical protein
MRPPVAPQLPEAAQYPRAVAAAAPGLELGVGLLAQAEAMPTAAIPTAAIPTVVASQPQQQARMPAVEQVRRLALETRILVVGQGLR